VTGESRLTDLMADLERSVTEAQAARDRRRGGHACHAEACTTTCPPQCLMCFRHWRMIPAPIQRAVWAEYVPGQCNLDPPPSAAWHEAAQQAIDAVAAKEGRR
jgi:hypothetical protein